MIESTSNMDRPLVDERSAARKRWLIGGALVAVLILAAFLFPGIARWSRSERAVDASTLRIGEVVRGDLLRDVSVQGRVIASLHPTLFSSSSGVITLRTKEGSVVRKGDVLAIIDSAELRSDLEQSRAALLSMRSEAGRQRITSNQTQLRREQASRLAAVRLDAAKRALAGSEKLRSEGLVGNLEYQKAQDDVRVATLEYEQARREIGLDAESNNFDLRDRELQVQRQAAATAELQRRADELTIRAPFDGMVANIAVSDRDAVSSSQPLLTVVNLSSLELEIAVPEEYAPFTVIGTPATISFGGNDYRGQVTAISPEVSGSQVNGRVAFAGAAPPGLKQNQRLTTRLVFDSRKGVLKVPRGAFLESGGGKFVYLVDNGVATKHPIDVGVIGATEVEIASGLKEGDRIVLSDTTGFNGATAVLLR